MIPPPLAPLEWLAFFISLFPFCSSSAGVIVAGWVLLLVCSRGEVFPGSPPWLPTPEVHCWLLTCAELSWLLPSYAVLPRWCEIFALHVVPKRWWLAGSCLCLDLALIPLLRRQLLLGVSEGRNARNMKEEKIDEPASPCITHPQESTTDCSCSSLENTLVTSVCKEIKTNKYMFYDVICLCWVFDILLKWPYRWATTLGQTWNHRLHFLKTDTAFLETVTGDPWVPLLWGQSKPPCVYDLHSELERARLFGESGLVKTLLNTNYVLVKLTCCAVLWDGG